MNRKPRVTKRNPNGDPSRVTKARGFGPVVPIDRSFKLRKSLRQGKQPKSYFARLLRGDLRQVFVAVAR